jgi:acetyl-CoA carboxylase carboxyl transferase subunit alpha
MPKEYLEFEKPVAKLEERIEKLKSYGTGEDPKTQEEIRRLSQRTDQLLDRLYAKLTPWERTQVARHPARPNLTDYLGLIFKDFIEFHGDRLFADDPAIITGIAKLDDQPCVVIGHQKGKTTREKIYRNFGMPNPEGYRKALRMMHFAEKYRRPIVTFIDTPGAYPGIGAEERGQGMAIARSLYEMSLLRVPIISVIIGEGGSGGALALGMGDRILMMEHAIYSVISPEGCAAILWGNTAKSSEAAEAMKMTADDLLRLGIIDVIVKEPSGGAHRNPAKAASVLMEAVKKACQDLADVPGDKLAAQRYDKYRKMGVWGE